MPGKAIQSYRESNLIDEIVITNEIEGVRSTRREIGDVLERLEENDKRGRFHGLVQKYQMLSREEDIAICTCADVRSIYDDLVLDEVARDNPDHVPDGTLFRKGPVSVCDATGIPIHKGMEPESKITLCLEKARITNLSLAYRCSTFFSATSTPFTTETAEQTDLSAVMFCRKSTSH